MLNNSHVELYFRFYAWASRQLGRPWTEINYLTAANQERHNREKSK